MKEYDAPLVSVVTLTYNNFEKIYETINSVLRQSYENIEYIICDDCSKNFDATNIRKYIEANKNDNLKRYKIITNDKNLGTVKNINKAYKNATGEYIINLSCNDVLFDNDVVSKIEKVFRKNKCEVVLTTRALYRNEYKPICFMPHLCEREYIKRKYYNADKQHLAIVRDRMYDMASGSALALKHDMIKRYGYFDEKYVLWEDGPFFYKYTQEKKMIFEYEIVSIWYQDGGVSATFIPRSEKMKNDLSNFHEELFNEQTGTATVNKSYSRYRLRRNQAKSIVKKLLICALYPQYSLSDLIYMCKRKINKKRDEKYISRYWNDKK